MAKDTELPVLKALAKVVEEFPLILKVTFAVVFDEKKYTVLFKISMLVLPPIAVVYTFAASNNEVIENERLDDNKFDVIALATIWLPVI
jgi:hypothetical protein